jgi:hypothetical protein
MRRVFAVLLAACVVAIAVGVTVNAQNPPARGMRGAGQVDEEEEHPDRRPPSGAGGLQRQDLHLRRLHAGDLR